MPPFDPNSKLPAGQNPAGDLDRIIHQLEELAAGDLKAAEAMVEGLKNEIDQCLKVFPAPGEKSKSG